MCSKHSAPPGNLSKINFNLVVFPVNLLNSFLNLPEKDARIVCRTQNIYKMRWSVKIFLEGEMETIENSKMYVTLSTKNISCPLTSTSRRRKFCIMKRRFQELKDREMNVKRKHQLLWDV